MTEISTETNNAIIAITALLCSYIVKTYNMDMTMYAALSTIITIVVKYCFSVTDKMGDNNYFNLTSLFNLYYLIVPVTYYIYSNRTYIMEKVFSTKREVDQNYIYINLNTDAHVKTYLSYIEHFPTMFEKPNELNLGSTTFSPNGSVLMPELVTCVSYNILPPYGIPIKFTDTNFNVSGFYICKNNKTNISKTKDGVDQFKESTFIELKINSQTCKDSLEYFNKIVDLVNKKNKETGKIILYHMKIFSNNMSSLSGSLDNKYIMYSGKQKSLDYLENQYMSTFFHPNKDKIWNFIKIINFTPEKIFSLGQPPQIGLLLHGPPGTGKSSFAYRIAMTLNRHIISLDIRAIKKKSKIFQTIRSPVIDSYAGAQLLPSNVVYIFDEFDITVTDLYNKDKNRSANINKWYKSIKTSSNKIDVNNSDKSNKSNKSDNNNDDQDNWDDDDNNQINNLQYPQYPSFIDDEDITLSDLLELFQGPVPLDGAIIIATTNKYEEIKEMCPALFRPGRLTPVYFGYPDSTAINQISNYYFKRNINIKHEYTLNIPYSQVMQYIMDAKLDDKNGFDYFETKIRSHIFL
jgi:hypothetical protein